MGYSTNLYGKFNLDKPLNLDQIRYLNRFASSRRFKRNESIVEKFHDPLREAVGLPIGSQGQYYVGSDELDAEILTKDDVRYNKNSSELHDDNKATYCGQRKDSSEANYNRPPDEQPGLWCQWIVEEDGLHIVWDENEKFYNYVEWLEYLIKHFLEPWGYVLNGEINWDGEEHDDNGIIYVKNNQVEAVENTVSNSGPSWDK